MQNYFTLLGLPEDFVLDVSALERVYFAKQREFHPDRQAGRDAIARQKAALASMEANEAYRVLKEPLTRAQHLLALQGIQVNTDGKDTVKPTPELLMEMMTLREELTECESPAQLETLTSHEQAVREELLQGLTVAFEAKDWQKAALLTLRLRYLEKFCEEARVMRSQKFKETL